MSNLRIFKYEGSPVQFEEVNGQLMANATLMAQACNKRAADWLKTDKAKDYIKAIGRKSVLTEKELVTIRNGGNDSGTWIHEKLILRFAQWLDTDFEIWCDDKVSELLRTGKVELSIPKTHAEALRAYALVIEENEKKDQLLLEAKPKVEYYDNVLNSKDLLTTTEVGQHIGIGAIKLNRILQEMGIQKKVNNTWTITASYVGDGLADLKTHPYKGSDGSDRTSQHLYWTQKGREFIYNKVNGII